MNSLLSMAEPVQCLSGTGTSELSNSVDGDDWSDSVLFGESVMPVSSCHCNLKTGYVLMGDLWVRLHQRSTEQEHRYVFNSDKCVVAPCTQVEVLVDVSHPSWRNNECDSWATDSLKIADG